MKTNRTTEEIDFQHFSDKSREITIYENGSDFIKAKFTKWADTRTPETIEITDSYRDRKFIFANFCRKLNRLEVHCINGQKFSKTTLDIEKYKYCKLECCQVIIVSYANETDAEKLEKCKRTKMDTPGHSKGSIIISNP